MGGPFTVLSRPISAPYTRPVFPGESSAKSGLRFCGIMLDPVTRSHPRRANPNSCYVHSTSSSAKGDMCITIPAAAAWK